MQRPLLVLDVKAWYDWIKSGSEDGVASAEI